MTRTSINSLGRAAQIIAHPGHELRVHHWLEIASALTFVLNELVAALLDQRIAYVVADAEEGYNPVHDVCRYLAVAAAALASQAARHVVGDFELPLAEHPDTTWPGWQPDTIRVELDDEALARKMRAAEAYSEMKAEVARHGHGATARGRGHHRRRCGAPATCAARRRAH